MNNSLVQISGKWLIKSEVNVLLSNGLIFGMELHCSHVKPLAINVQSFSLQPRTRYR